MDRSKTASITIRSVGTEVKLELAQNEMEGKGFYRGYGKKRKFVHYESGEETDDDGFKLSS
jgi:hypothetical protein